jgi:hypothetical protein
MAIGSRVSLPQNYYDKTSDDLLVQPEPQYFYAQLFIGALAASLTVPSELGLPWRSIGGFGAEYGTPALRDRLYLASPMMTDVIAAKVDFNGAPGNTIRINRPAYATTTYTESSRRITTGSTISTVPIAAASEQANLTLFKYGGPYDQTNSRIAPLAIEAFDANMGVHKLAQITGNTMVRDYHRFIDAVNVTLLDLASVVVYPEGMTADNDATAKGSFPFTFEQLVRGERKADEANLPTFADGSRCCVLSPTQVAQLGLDPLYARQSAFWPMYNMLFPNYVKSVGKTHIFKSTTLTQASNSSSVKVNYGHYMAPGVLLAGMGRPPHVAPSTDDNYGETAKVIWIADLAFGLADNRFVISMRSSEDAS